MLEVIQLKMSDIKPYEHNAKLHPPEQVEQIKQSILQYGMNDPVAVWGPDNELVEGHGRYLALQELEVDEVDAIRLDHLTDEQRRAYTLVHNKLTMNTDFDIDVLNAELARLSEDLTEFDFEVPEIEVPEGPDYYGQERERTGDAYNLWDYDEYRTEGYYQIPILEACDYVPKDLIGFNYVLSTSRRDTGVHFFLDDYQFERIWSQPDKYLDKLSEFECVLTPDFSLYVDMPRAMKIWNVYRSRLIGQMLQDSGVNVIPTLQWAEPETFQFVFDGLRPGGTVAVSTVGVMKDKDALEIWRSGMAEALKRVRPKTVVLYGSDKIDFDFGKIEVVFIKSREFKEQGNSNGR